MINKLKAWFMFKVYEYARKIVIARSQDHRDLHEFLNLPENKHLSFILSRTLAGRKLEFKWVEAPERGHYAATKENLNNNNAMFTALKKHGAFSGFNRGQVIREPLSFKKDA